MNFGFSGEMVFLFFLALILFGPKKLPEIGRTVGRLMNEFRRASNEFRSQIESEINAVGSDVKPQILPPLKEPLGAIASRIFNPPAGAEAPKASAPAAADNSAMAVMQRRSGAVAPPVVADAPGVPAPESEAAPASSTSPTTSPTPPKVAADA